MKTRVLVILLAAAVALSVGPAGGADASVRTSQSFTVPASGRFHIAGHGFGHGHGMSQYGAEGAARKGLSYREILAFYYPHTRLKRMRGTIRVLITADTSPAVKVVARKGLRVVDRGTKKHRSYALPRREGVHRWRLVVRHGHTQVQFRTTRWHRFRLGKKKHAHLQGNGEFRVKKGTLTLISRAGRVHYRGALRGVRRSRGSAHLRTVNVVGINKYVRGVVAREMPTVWHRAAVRAQVVAARTYALFERAEHRHRSYQICDTSACQVYGGASAETTAGNAAVRATSGRYLSYRGSPAFTQFSSSNGGRTLSGSLPYLPGKADPYDGWSGNPVHSWKVKARARVLQDRYPALGTLEKITVTRRTGGGQWHGRVLSVRLTGSRHSRTVSGSDIAAAYGLRSTWFIPVQ